MSNTLGIVIITLGLRPDWLKAAHESAQGVADQIEVVHDKYGPVQVDGHTYRGIADSANAGISALNTDWVMRLDDDDVLIGYEAQALLHKIKKESQFWGCEVVTVQCELFGMATGLFGSELSDQNTNPQNNVACGSWFRRSMWQMVGQYSALEFEDWHFWRQCLFLGAKSVHHIRPIYRHRMHEQSAGATMNLEERLYWTSRVMD